MMKSDPYGNLVLKIYHIHPLLLVFILLLTSCAVNQTVDPKDVIQTSDEFEQGMYRAKVLYDQAVQKLRKTDPEAHRFYHQAHTAEVNGELVIAIEGYHKAIQKAPENELLLTTLGMAYLRNEDIIPARRYLRKAVSFNPGDYKPRLGLGYIYLHNQQFKAAVNQLELSLKLLPTLEGTFLLGEAEEAQGNLSRAKQLYQTVVQVNKNSKLGKSAATRLRSLSE